MCVKKETKVGGKSKCSTIASDLIALADIESDSKAQGIKNTVLEK